jgi:hypothetical protein
MRKINARKRTVCCERNLLAVAMAVAFSTAGFAQNEGANSFHTVVVTGKAEDLLGYLTQHRFEGCVSLRATLSHGPCSPALPDSYS